MTTKLFERVAIVGPGLVGGSLGMGLKQNGLAAHVVGIGHRQASLDRALDMGAIDEGTLDLAAGVAGADLVVLAASVTLICEHAAMAVPAMKPGAVLTDVGSVKQAICDHVQGVLARHPDAGVRFVGAHPLAGSEQRGIDAARPDLFGNAVCVLTPTEETDAGAIESIRSMWQTVGCRILEYPPDVHDRLLAEVSHLPHMVASCLVNAASQDALGLAATGFLDTTRVASGDAALWRDICLLNRRALAHALETFAEELQRFADKVATGDAETLMAFLAAAKERRDTRLKPDANDR